MLTRLGMDEMPHEWNKRIPIKPSPYHSIQVHIPVRSLSKQSSLSHAVTLSTLCITHVVHGQPFM